MPKLTKTFLILSGMGVVSLLALNACQPDAPVPEPSQPPVAAAKVSTPSQPALATPAAATQTLSPTATAPSAPSPTPPPQEAPTEVPTEAPSPTPSFGTGSTYLSPSDGMTLVYVPAGEFLMGLDGEAYYQLWNEIIEVCPHCKITQDDETPQHAVYLDAYWIDQTEVTNAMYAACVAAGACEVPQPKEYETELPEIFYDRPGYEDFPMVNVNWFQAQAYCEWAGRRLPSEAEWEKAARGTDGRAYPWGNEPDCLRANYRDCSINSLTRTGRYPRGASPYGALDMAGNAREWVADWYSRSYYDLSEYANPQGPAEGKGRVLRDGHWDSWNYSMRTTGRDKLGPSVNYFFNFYGFRCALSADALTAAQEANITPVAVQPTATPTLSPTPTQAVWPEVTPAVIKPYCSVEDQSPVMIQANQPVTLAWSWGATTAELVQDHIDAANYTIRFEDQPVNANRRSPIEHVGDGDYYRVTWYADLGMLLPGEYFSGRGLEWSQQISDGWNTYGPGGEFETVGDYCDVIVEEATMPGPQPYPACVIDLWEEIELREGALILTQPDIRQGAPVANPGGALYMMGPPPWWGPLRAETAGYGYWYGIGDVAGPEGGLLGYVWEGDIVGCVE